MSVADAVAGALTPGVDLRTATVSGAASAGYARVVFAGASETQDVPYLAWYTPVSGDVVQILMTAKGSALVLGKVAAGAGANLIWNASFEDVEGGMPLGWAYYPVAAPTPTITVDTGVGVAWHGQGALKLSRIGNNGMGQHIAQDPPVSVVPGQTYELSAYVRGSVAITHGSIPPLSLWTWWGADEVVEPGSSGYSAVQVQSSNLTATWFRYASGTVTVPAGKTWLRGGAQIRTAAGVTAQVLLDYFELKRLS